MRGSGHTGGDSEPVATDHGTELRIECYVRSDVSAVSVRQIEATIERLDDLTETEFVSGYDVVQWPPEYRTPVDSDAGEETRSEILAGFEHWADRNGYSLEPAFRRREVPTSLLGHDEPRQEVRVPLVALVLYEEQTDELEGVVPYTDGERTHTVHDWLAAAERTATLADGTAVVHAAGRPSYND
jgi:hypothetical protein